MPALAAGENVTILEELKEQNNKLLRLHKAENIFARQFKNKLNECARDGLAKEAKAGKDVVGKDREWCTRSTGHCVHTDDSSAMCTCCWKRTSTGGPQACPDATFAAVADYVLMRHWTSTVEQGAGSKDANFSIDTLFAAFIECLNGQGWAIAWHDNASLEKSKVCGV